MTAFGSFPFRRASSSARSSAAGDMFQLSGSESISTGSPPW
jgi:hypothetical protein